MQKSHCEAILNGFLHRNCEGTEQLQKGERRMGEVILTMKDIDKSFAGVHALDHVNFEVKRGEVHALMGENGAGKSTLMKVLTGIYTKDSGTIYFIILRNSICNIFPYCKGL